MNVTIQLQGANHNVEITDKVNIVCLLKKKNKKLKKWIEKGLEKVELAETYQ